VNAVQGGDTVFVQCVSVCLSVSLSVCADGYTISVCTLANSAFHPHG